MAKRGVIEDSDSSAGRYGDIPGNSTAPDGDIRAANAAVPLIIADFAAFQNNFTVSVGIEKDATGMHGTVVTDATAFHDKKGIFIITEHAAATIARNAAAFQNERTIDVDTAVSVVPTGTGAGNHTLFPRA